MKVSAKTKEKPTPVVVEVNIPDTLQDLQKSYGDDVVAAAAKGAIIISLQAFMRRHIEKGTALPEIQKEASAWRPDVRTVVKQTALEKASSSIKQLSPEERKALLAQLQALK
jgi:hypothetical protein